MHRKRHRCHSQSHGAVSASNILQHACAAFWVGLHLLSNFQVACDFGTVVLFMCSCPSHWFVLAKAVFWYLNPLFVRRYHVVGGAAATVSSIGGWLQGGGLSGSTGMRIWGFGVDQAGVSRSSHKRGVLWFNLHSKCYTPQKVYDFWCVVLCCWKWQMSCLLGWIGLCRRRGLQLGDVRQGFNLGRFTSQSIFALCLLCKFHVVLSISMFTSMFTILFQFLQSACGTKLCKTWSTCIVTSQAKRSPVLGDFTRSTSILKGILMSKRPTWYTLNLYEYVFSALVCIQSKSLVGSNQILTALDCLSVLYPHKSHIESMLDLY